MNNGEMNAPRRGMFGGWMAWAIVLVILVVALVAVVVWQTSGDDEDEGEAADAGIVIEDAWVRATTAMAAVPDVEVTGVAPEGMAGMESTAEATGDMEGMEDMPPGGSITAAYMTITNNADAEDVLTGVTCDDAEAVEIHETVMEDDVMQMRPLEDGLTIPANGTVSLAPGGIHLMMLGIDATYEPGQTVQLTLNFASGKQLTVDAEVRAADTTG